MNADRDTTRIVRSWLRTDEHESADRVLDDVLARLGATPQRRSTWSARRIADMNTYAKLAIATAAVIAVITLLGINLLPASGGMGGPAASPTASPTPSPSPAPSPPASAPAQVFPPSGDLAVGRHDMSRNGVAFTLAIPTTGWVSNGSFGIDRSEGIGPEGAGFIFWDDPAVGVFAEPCSKTPGPRIGSSPSELAAAVAAVPGTDLVSGPTDVTIGGYPAKQVVVTVREDVGCKAGDFYLWYADAAGEERYATELGSTIRTWIIDVDGAIVWIDGETYKGADPRLAQGILQIIDSIQFE